MNKSIKHTALLLILSMTALIQGAQQPQQPNSLDKADKILKIGLTTLILLPIASGIIKNIINEAHKAKHPKTKVGVITIQDAIVDSTRYIKQLHDFFENDNIKAIVLKIASPGGASGTSQAIFNEILALKKTHPKMVVAFIENVAASGAYYIAAAADKIIATPSAIVGSIGCYLEVPVFHEFLKQYNVKFEYIKNGEHKTAGNPLAELTDAQRKHLQSVSNDIYEQFVSDIATARAKASLSPDSNIWAQGKIFTGKKAKELGLVDYNGSISTVVEVLKNEAQITHKIEWIHAQPNSGLLTQLLGSPDDGSYLQSCVQSVTQGVANAFKSQTSHHVSATY